MVSTVAPPTDRTAQSLSVAPPTVPSDSFAAEPVYDHTEPIARRRPRVRRLVVFTGKLS